jgi:hypothetical protein
MKRLATAAALAGALSLNAGMARAPQAANTSFACENNYRVRVGLHLIDVIGGCGEPDHALQRIEKNRIKYKTGVRCSCHHAEVSEERVIETLVDDLVYDFGVNRKAHHLRFENGFLVSIHARWIPGPP